MDSMDRRLNISFLVGLKTFPPFPLWVTINKERTIEEGEGDLPLK